MNQKKLAVEKSSAKKRSRNPVRNQRSSRYVGISDLPCARGLRICNMRRLEANREEGYLFLRLHVLADASIHAAHLPHVQVGLPRHLHHALLEAHATHPVSDGRGEGVVFVREEQSGKVILRFHAALVAHPSDTAITRTKYLLLYIT